MKKKKSIAVVMSLGRILIITFIISVLFAPLVCVIAFQLAYKDKIYPGLKTGNWDLGEKTSTEAQELLTEKVQNSGYQLTLTFEEKNFTFDLDQLDLKFYPQKTTDQAFQYGRNHSWSQNLKQQYRAFTKGEQIPLSFSFDETLFKTNLASISAQIVQPEIPFSLILEDKKVKAKAGQLGTQVNIAQLIAQIKSNLEKGQFENTMTIPTLTTGWLPSSEQINQTLAQSQKLVGKSIVLSSSQQTFILTDKELIEFLDFKGGFDQEKITLWLTSLAQGFEKEPQSALFKFENGKVTEFSPEIQGLKLEKEQAANLVLRSLNNLLENGQTKAILELPVKKTDPEITIANTNQLGITGLIAKGESWFSHSIASRVHNIKTGANRLNGILIKPGEEFSFNKAVGEVSQKTGYQQAWIIKEGRTILDDGGGMCQVSTTMFRAALNSGLPITERRAHSYRVSYYEQNTELGTDATVFSPSVDLKFKNDYPCHLLIQTELDLNSSYLAFNIYGCPDERKVTINNFQTWGIVPPPPPSYVDDPNLPQGTTKRIESPAWGAKASFDWKVEKRGETLYEQTFYSNYRPWQAIYLQGTRPL